MATPVQITFDCADPDRLAHFWADLLGYQLDSPPDGFDSWEAWLNEQGIPESEWNSASAITDPDGPDRASSSSACRRRSSRRTGCIST